jgi:hypothetical protein
MTPFLTLFLVMLGLYTLMKYYVQDASAKNQVLLIVSVLSLLAAFASFSADRVSHSAAVQGSEKSIVDE